MRDSHCSILAGVNCDKRVDAQSHITLRALTSEQTPRPQTAYRSYVPLDWTISCQYGQYVLSERTSSGTRRMIEWLRATYLKSWIKDDRLKHVWRKMLERLWLRRISCSKFGEHNMLSNEEFAWERRVWQMWAQYMWEKTWSKTAGPSGVLADMMEAAGEVETKCMTYRYV